MLSGDQSVVSKKAETRRQDQARLVREDRLRHGSEAHDFRAAQNPLEGLGVTNGPCVELSEKTMVDSKGRVSQPLIVADTLLAMFRRKTITVEMLAAGQHFQADFAHASLDTLRAADASRVPGGAGGSSLTERVKIKRNDVDRAIRALGGRRTPPAAAAWAILGEGLTLKVFAERSMFGSGNALDPKTAAGFLMSALGILAVHYGYEKSKI